MKQEQETLAMSWLRLTKAQERVLLMAWTSDTIVFRGHDLNVARRLERRELLHFIRPVDGGLGGEFRLTEVAREYPPIGLKALIVHYPGSRDVGGAA
jgi:hypothetical protein